MFYNTPIRNHGSSNNILKKHNQVDDRITTKKIITNKLVNNVNESEQEVLPPNVKIISSNISFSHVTEPNSIYDFSDIIDSDELPGFEMDHQAYSDEIQRKFLHKRSYILSTHAPSIRTSRSSKSIDSTTLPATTIAQRSSATRNSRILNVAPDNAQNRKAIESTSLQYVTGPILQHRKSSITANQFIVNNKNFRVTTEETTLSAAFHDKQTSHYQHDKNKVNCMSLKALLEKFLPKEGYIPSRKFLFDFFLVIRQYVILSDVVMHLIRSLTKICDGKHKMNSGSFKHVQNHCSKNCSMNVFVQSIIYLMTYWIQTIPYDFRSPSVMQRTRDLFALCLMKSPLSFVDVRSALRMLYAKLTRLEVFEDYLDRENRIPHVDMDLTIMDICRDPARLAEQLVLLEIEHLSHIGPEEYVQYLNAHRRISRKRSSLIDYGSEETKSLQISFDHVINRSRSYSIHMTKDAHSSQKYTFNLEAYIRWVNRLSYYVTTEIVKQRKKRIRAAHIEYFIEVAKCCLELNNFNSTIGIISGLDDIAVKRLIRTWDRVSYNHRTKFRYFQTLMSVSNNFASYRGAVSNVMKSDYKFYVPFLCVSLKDLYYINEVMPDVVEEDQINIEKMEKMGALVSELVRVGNNSAQVKFRRLDNVIRFLYTCPVLDSATSMQMSVELESDSE
ncbi:hypothetical protein GJ496_011689 [Pomphorhynchus laevis]|nr:hypothetical protein GJ496_011689 [Pomphorhynchus laevis]